jgi:hypothetical protein
MLALAGLALAFGAVPGRAAVWLDPLHNDSGSYRVYAGQRLLGSERFELTPKGDSVLVISEIDQMLPLPGGDQRLQKKIAMVFRALDYGLLDFTSETHLRGQSLSRGIVPADTTFTGYHEMDGRGYGDTMARPPGRFYIIDSQAFVLFDILLRSLHGRLVGERAVPVVFLAEPRDTVFDITVRPGATETRRWSGKSIPMKKVTLTDGTSEFIAWLSPEGRMLRLEQPVTALRVERDPAGPDSTAHKAAVKPATAPAKKPATKPAAH